MFSKCVTLFGLAQGVLGQGHGFKSSEHVLSREPVGLAPPAETFVAEETLPADFDWRSINGKSYVTNDWNQHIPQYCGACWIHATTSALNDRIKIMRQGAYPDVMLGRQTIANCVPAADGGPPPGCDGGDAWLIHDYMHKNPGKIPDETCLGYQARNMACEPFNVCRNCANNGTCWAVTNYVGYGVSSYGKVTGEKAMMKEIYARGPIVCSFATQEDFVFHYSENAVQHEGVFATPIRYNASQIDHNMEVAGWGVTPGGIKYWSVRNSWGTYWGEGGWLKLRRGVNELQSESDCAWAVPTWKDLDTSLEGKVIGDYVRGEVSTVEMLKEVNGGKVFGQESLASSTASGGVAQTSLLFTLSLTFVVGTSVGMVLMLALQRKHTREQPFLLG